MDVLRYSSASSFPKLSPALGRAVFAPQLSPAPGQALLHRLANTVHQFGQAGSHLSTIFDLCVALWGKLDYGWMEDAGERETIGALVRFNAMFSVSFAL